MARGLLVEGVVGMIGIWFLLPHYGILGVAWITGVLAVVNRGLYVPWLVCHALRSSFAGYMQGIYLRPILTAIPVVVLVHFIKLAGISGRTWPQLISMGIFTAACFFAPAFFTCATREHRTMMVGSVTGIVKRFVTR
jgi:quinol-cytochrome oxidoreductase complex cytochrome b subunit